MTKNKLAKWQAEHPGEPLPPDKIKYKRRTMGIGSAKGIKGGLSLDEAREKAVLLTMGVRKGIDPIEAEKKAKEERESRTDENMTVGDAMNEYYINVFQHKTLDYRRKNKAFYDRIKKGLGLVTLRAIVKSPQLIVDRLDMRQRWHDHRAQEQAMLLQLYRAIEHVRRRCGLAENPAVIKGCLEHCGLPAERTKPKGHYVAPEFKDMPIILQRARDYIITKTGQYPAGVRPTSGYLLEFILLSCVRSGEARQMQYKELEYDAVNKNWVWTAPLEHLKKVKGGNFTRPVPLTKPMLDIIEAMRSRRFDQSEDAYVFPSPLPKRNGRYGLPYAQPQLDKTIEKVWDMDVHGARTAARMWATYNEYPELRMDRQQGRREKGVGGTHYGRMGRPYLEDETFPLRKKMMEHWARHCTQSTNVKVTDIAPARKHRSRKAA